MEILVILRIDVSPPFLDVGFLLLSYIIHDSGIIYC
jgi:hypothetical protein